MKPLYYRFVYSPTTGDVDLSHNQETHPANVPTHGEMANDRPEHDLLTGYAYRLDGGWRILDADHRPVNDPHIIASVVASLARSENFRSTIRANAGWDLPKRAGQGGPVTMPCPICHEVGCNNCEVPQGYVPHLARVHYGHVS